MKIALMSDPNSLWVGLYQSGFDGNLHWLDGYQSVVDMDQCVDWMVYDGWLNAISAWLGWDSVWVGCLPPTWVESLSMVWG